MMKSRKTVCISRERERERRSLTDMPCIESAYLRAFTLMAQEQFITAVLPQHSRSVTDRYMEAEAKELEKYTIITSGEAKQIKEIAKANADAIYQQEEFVGMVSGEREHRVLAHSLLYI